MNIIIFLIILVVLVVSHEFGHFIVAKKAGMRVDEFSFGFPPKLFGIKRGETSYNFNLLPLGGYVKIYGENGDVEEEKDEKIVKEIRVEEIITETIDKDGEVSITETEEIKENIKIDNDRSRSFVNKPKYKQALVLVAGIVMNLLVAWVLLSIGLMSGMPSSVSTTPKDIKLTNESVMITGVANDSPAEKAGLKIGDKIISLNTENDSTLLLSSNFTTETVQSFIKEHQNDELDISIERNGLNEDISVTPEKMNGEDTPKVGISMDMIGTLKLPFGKAVWEGLKSTVMMTWGTMVGFYNLITKAFVGKANISSLTGPVGIVGVVGDAASFGFVYLLSFIALISVNLAVINLIPFPALDGGRLLFLLIEKIKGSRIKPEIAGWTNAIGFGLLMILMVIITYHDVIKLVK